MELLWTSPALADLDRLYQFLEAVSPQAAARVVQKLVAAPNRLLKFPRLGERLNQLEPREVRRILAGNYEIRYEIQGITISVLSVWHAREDR
jgi:plasmid stabilization system protein ParE